METEAQRDEIIQACLSSEPGLVAILLWSVSSLSSCRACDTALPPVTLHTLLTKFRCQWYTHKEDRDSGMGDLVWSARLGV